MVSSSDKVNQELFEIINRARKEPTSIVPKLEEMLLKFDGLVLKREGECNLRTNEGAKAVQDAIDFLKAQEPLHELTLEPHLCSAAKDHVDDIGSLGK